MKRSIAIAAAAGLIATAASAQDAAPAPAKPAKEKKMCRREVPTGSVMAKITCHTKAEWAQIDSANGDAAQRAFDNRNHSGG